MPAVNITATKFTDRNARARMRKALRYHKTTGKLFYTWGEVRKLICRSFLMYHCNIYICVHVGQALGKKLDYLCSIENGATFVLPNVRSDAEKMRLRDTDVREDFLRDSKRTVRSFTLGVERQASSRHLPKQS